MIFHSQSARLPICLSFEHNLQWSLLVPHLFPPHHGMLQWLWLLPYLNLPFLQASDISNSLPKSGNVHDVCLVCLDLIFVTFKIHSSRSRAYMYCDCKPIRAFETLNNSKEPISKTSRFWVFWHKQGTCNWPSTIKGMAVWSRGFLRGSPKTVHEKPIAPRVRFSTDRSTASSQMLGQSLFDMSYFVHVNSKITGNKFSTAKTHDLWTGPYTVRVQYIRDHFTSEVPC